MFSLSYTHLSQRIFSVLLSISLLMPLFASQGVSLAYAQAAGTGYEFRNLPQAAQDALHEAIQSRPSGVLEGGTYFVVGHYESEGIWGIGHLAAAIGSEPPDWDRSIWFITQTKNTTRAAVQGTPLFNTFLIDLPESFSAQINIPGKNEIGTQASNFLFPWDKSQQWRYSYGWHGSTNLTLDFAPVNVSPANMWVLASASGSITLVCSDDYQAAINLSAPGGVMTYRHIDYNSFIAQDTNNKAVTQGQKLSILYNGTEGESYRDTSKPYPWPACTPGSSPSCVHVQFMTYCGSGSGPHVHWTLPAKPFTVDGWEVGVNAVWTKNGQTKGIGSSFTSTNPPAASQERAKNGGFNTYAGASKVPTYWTVAKFAAADGKFTTAKQEGTASVRVIGQSGITKTLTQSLPLSGATGDIFTFSFWAKGAAIPAAGICQAQVFLYNGATLQLTKTIPCKIGTYSVFAKKTLSFTATSTYTKAIIKFTYRKASGAVWFDAVSLSK